MLLSGSLPVPNFSLEDVKYVGSTTCLSCDFQLSEVPPIPASLLLHPLLPEDNRNLPRPHLPSDIRFSATHSHSEHAASTRVFAVPVADTSISFVYPLELSRSYLFPLPDLLFPLSLRSNVLRVCDPRLLALVEACQLLLSRVKIEFVSSIFG